MNTTKVAKLVSKNAKPALPHDCPKCRFLGRLNGDDIYVCQDEIVVRKGWEDNDYGCWPVGLKAPEGSVYAFSQRLLQHRLRPGTSMVPAEYRA